MRKIESKMVIQYEAPNITREFIISRTVKDARSAVTRMGTEAYRALYEMRRPRNRTVKIK